MNIETVRADLIKRLSPHFTVSSVKSYQVDKKAFRLPSLRAKDIFAVEFILNNSERYISFVIEAPHGIAFTRPKEGIVRYLINELRDRDFYFTINDTVYSRYDMVGRLIENWINVRALKIMKDVINDVRHRTGNYFDHCIGYKITQHHKQTMTFDAELEVLVDKGTGEFIPFTVYLVSGMLHKVTCNEIIVEIDDLFNDRTEF